MVYSKQKLISMKKIISKIIDVYNWISTDGMLHFLSCYSITLTTAPVAGKLEAVAISSIIGLLKEGYDYFIKKNCNKDAVIHDLICDASGIACAILASFIIQAQ